MFHHTGKLVPGTGIAPARLLALASKTSVSTVPPPGQIGADGGNRTLMAVNRYVLNVVCLLFHHDRKMEQNMGLAPIITSLPMTARAISG